MQYKPRKRPISKAYYSRDYFWEAGKYFIFRGEVLSKGDKLLARVYENKETHTALVALLDGAPQKKIDKISEMFQLVENKTGLYVERQTWEANNGRWES